MKHHAPTILVVEDDPDERLLLRRALGEGRFNGVARFVQTQEELHAYLAREGRFAHPAEAPFPNLLVLDLHVIRENVPQLVHELKQGPLTRRVPIVVLTPPISEEDCRRCYDAGVNALLEKPLGYDEFRSRITAMLDFWFDVVSLPATF